MKKQNKEKRFERVVEGDSNSSLVFLGVFVFLGCIFYSINETEKWDMFLLGALTVSGAIIILLSILSSDRKVYWREIK